MDRDYVISYIDKPLVDKQSCSLAFNAIKPCCLDCSLISCIRFEWTQE